MAARLRLVKVTVHHDARTKNNAVSVQLMFGRLEFIGHCSVNREDLVLQAISLATFDAVNQALMNVAGASFQIRVEVVEKLRPLYLQYPLVVVVVSMTAKSEKIKVIGAVISEDENACHAAAAASLDAINRQIDFILAGPRETH